MSCAATPVMSMVYLIYVCLHCLELRANIWSKNAQNGSHQHHITGLGTLCQMSVQHLFDLMQIPELCSKVQYDHLMQDKERMEREKKRVKEKLEREKKKDEVAQSKAAEKLRQLQIREAKKAAEKAVKEQRAEERKRLQDEKRRCAFSTQSTAMLKTFCHHDAAVPQSCLASFDSCSARSGRVLL